MRGPSKDLHELSQALSPREITSCRKRMREFDSDMRRLFEAFLSHTEYNDADFRAATGRIWNDNQWSVAKNYLHQSIMMCFRPSMPQPLPNGELLPSILMKLPVSGVRAPDICPLPSGLTAPCNRIRSFGS